jgi:hypothetical protein
MNQRMKRGVLAAIATLSVASCGGGGAPASDCPSDEEVKKSITHNVADITWDAGERDIWKVADVSGFQFGPMKAGRLVDKQVEWGKPAQPVCPIRVEFGYKITGRDGSVKDKQEGENQTYLFYRNAFDEWVYKTESG